MSRIIRFAIRLTLLISMQLAWANSALSGPVRVASLNLCTDQLLLALADSNQVASVTFLSRHGPSSYMASKATQHHINYGQAEELIPIRPDIVTTLTYTAPMMSRLLRNLGFRVELFSPANNVSEAITNIRRMAQLLSQEARGERIIKTMRERFRSLGSESGQANMPRGILYEPNGYTAGAQTLRGDLIRLAGWYNIATEVGIEGVGVIGLETLILAKPGRLIFSPYAPGTSSLGQRVLEHPALSAVTSNRTPLIVPPRFWICGGPMNTEAVARLIEGR